MTLSDRVPAAMREKFDTLSAATDAFCDLRLNDEYKALIRLALAGLCRKRPSPLLKGTNNAWAAGAVQAIGATNFLFDPSQTPPLQGQRHSHPFCREQKQRRYQVQSRAGCPRYGTDVARMDPSQPHGKQPAHLDAASQRHVGRCAAPALGSARNRLGPRTDPIYSGSKIKQAVKKTKARKDNCAATKNQIAICPM